MIDINREPQSINLINHIIVFFYCYINKKPYRDKIVVKIIIAYKWTNRAFKICSNSQYLFSLLFVLITELKCIQCKQEFEYA